jgi:hypothetical protein
MISLKKELLETLKYELQFIHFHYDNISKQFEKKEKCTLKSKRYSRKKEWT